MNGQNSNSLNEKKLNKSKTPYLMRCFTFCYLEIGHFSTTRLCRPLVVSACIID